MLQIYGRKNSSQVIQVMWTVAELNLDHTRHNLGGSFGGLDTQEYRSLNPNGLVPTIDDDGFVLWESYAIIRYLCHTYGQGSLWPQNPQTLALADQWMEWANSRFMPVFFPVFWSLIRTPKEQQNPDEIASKSKDSAELLQIVERQLQGKLFITGDTLTMGDIPLGSLMFKYYSLDIDRPSLPNIEAWYKRLGERSAYRQHAMNPFGANTEEWLAIEQSDSI